MGRTPAVALLHAMVLEEWRLHAELFGGRRFAGFPLFVAAAGAGAVWLLVRTGSSPTDVALGLHLLVLVFGLYTGSAGLVGRDAMHDLLGEVTLVIFAARPLPVDGRRLLLAFLVKDVGFYSVLFLLPLTVAYAPAAVVAGTLGRLPLLWLTLALSFVLGVAITLAALAARSRGAPGVLVAVAVALATGLAWAVGIDLLGLSPYGFYRDSGDAASLVGLLVTAVLAGAGIAGFDPAHAPTARTAEARFDRLRRRLRDDDGLLTKTLLDVSRSGGGVWKVAFSGGVLFVVTAALVELAGSITGLEPSTGLSFGSMLALSAFTTYNWVTQFDDLESYLAFPLDAAAVFEAKGRAFVLLGLPTALGYYGLAVGFWGERLSVTVAGAALLVGLSVYLFGLTVALAGLSPNEFLFDTVRFVGFTLGAAVVLVPVLVVAFVLRPPAAGLAGLAVLGLLLGGVGFGLFRWAVPRWTVRYHEG